MKRTLFAPFAVSLSASLLACSTSDGSDPTPPAEVFATTAPNAVRLRMTAVLDGAGRDVTAHFPDVVLRFTFDVDNATGAARKTGRVKLHSDVEEVVYDYSFDQGDTLQVAGGSSIGISGEATGLFGFGLSRYQLGNFGAYRFADATLAVGSTVTAAAAFTEPASAEVTTPKAQPATVRFVVTPAEDPPVAATPRGPALPDGRYLPLFATNVQFATPFLPSGPFELEVDGKKGAVSASLQDDLWSYFADETGLGTTNASDYSDRVLRVPAGTDWLGRAVPATTVPVRAFRPDQPATLDFSTDADTTPAKLALLGGARVVSDPACEKGRCVVLEPRPLAAGERCDDDTLPTAVFGFATPSGPEPSFRFRVLGKQASDADRVLVVHTFGRGALRLPPLEASTAVAGYPFDSGWQSVTLGNTQSQVAARLVGCTPGVKYLLQGVVPTAL